MFLKDFRSHIVACQQSDEKLLEHLGRHVFGVLHLVEKKKYLSNRWKRDTLESKVSMPFENLMPKSTPVVSNRWL